MSKLNSLPSLVQAPFVIAKIGHFTFGEIKKSGSPQSLNITFPNFIEGLQVVKINGEVNQYTLNLVYQIAAGDDPNKIDYVFSTVSKDRLMTLSYGDWCEPTYIFREEEVLITSVTSSIDFSSSRINYTVQGTSTALNLASTNQDWPTRVAKPSTILMEIINNKEYGISDVLSGMWKKSNVMQFIASDDQVVKLEAKHNTSTLDYMNFLVSSMKPIEQQPFQINGIYEPQLGDASQKPSATAPVFDILNETKTYDNSWVGGGGHSTDGARKFTGGGGGTSFDGPEHRGKSPTERMKEGGEHLWAAMNGIEASDYGTYGNHGCGASFYQMSFVDDIRNEYGGSYMKVSKVSSDSLDCDYTIDVGYPGDNFVTAFSINNDYEYPILYEANRTVGSTENYSFRITSDGKMEKKKVPSLFRNDKLECTAEDEQWWNEMINFPVTATIQIKGLIKPVILVSKVYIDVRFFGQKHIASGIYSITKQVDTINGSGYQTTLELLRTGDYG